MHTSISLSLAVLASATLSSATSLVSRDYSGFTYVACHSAYDFQYTTPYFVKIADSPSMTVELCTSACDTGYLFAALYGSQCYCGQNFSLDPTGLESECNTPCPGDSSEICGGFAPNVTRGSEWRSVYYRTWENFSSSSSSVVSTTTAVQYTTSTIYTTQVYTVTSCAEVVTNCPATLSTSLVSVSTTVYPVVTPSTVTSSLVLATTLASTSATTFKPATTVVPGNSTTTAAATTTGSTVTFTGAATSNDGRFALFLPVLGLLAFL